MIECANALPAGGVGVSFWLRVLRVAACAGLTCLTAAAPPALAQTAAEGELEVVIEDHPTFSRTRHYLKTDSGRLELKFSGAAPSLRGGSRLHVRGRQTGTVLELSSTDTAALTITVAAPPANTQGEQKIAVLMANFNNDTRQPYTAAQVSEVVFGQTNGFVKENSSQKTWLSGNVLGWYTLPIASTCDGFTIASWAKNAAASAGVDLSGYARFVFLFPVNPNCGWAGQATMGSSANYMWVNGKMELLVFGHELGHSLGLYHAHAMECGAVAVGSSCSSLEYGDTVNIMGNNVAGHLSSADKLRLGWMSDASASVKTVTTGGSHLLDAYAGPGAGNPKALKLPRGTDPATGAQRWYFVEYHPAIGYDAPLAGIYGTNVTSGVVVRVGTDGDANSAHLLDMTPDSSFYTDWFDPALGFGRSFTDPATGVTITAVAGSGATAQVDVGFSGSSGCQRANPAVSMSGGASAVAAGTTVAYTVSITNRDSASCGGSNYVLTPLALPSGWASTLSATTLTVAPGASAALTSTVTSPATAAAGSYPTGADAANAAATGYHAAGSGTYTVAAAPSSSSLTTTVSTNRSTYQVGDTVASTARVLAGAAPAGGVSVRFVFVKPNGTTATKSATTDAGGKATVNYRLARKDPAGLWRVDGSASDVSATATASSSFTLQ